MMRKHMPFILALVFVCGFLCINDAEAKYTDEKGLTVTINIDKHYEVAFNANGGTGLMDNQEFTSGVSQALSLNTFEYDGYYFTGWNTEVDGSGTQYADGKLITEDLTNIGGSVVPLYAQWEENAMHTVFEIGGTCVFHGYDMKTNPNAGFITGENCSYNGIDWADGTHKYIDTGVKLYDSTDYSKDFEVGFTITAYNPNAQLETQSSFFNSKLENESRHWPGIVVRKNSNKIEVTETITKPNGTSEKKTGDITATTPVKVIITRVDEAVYYSVNGGAFTLLQNNAGTSDYFDVNAWFGASATADGAPMRHIDATMTDMYIKIGDKGSNKHTVSFDAGGIVADPADVTVISTSKLGSIPSMPNYVDIDGTRLFFAGWYSGIDGAGDKYDEDSEISHDITLYAYWSEELAVCEIGNESHGSLSECLDSADVGDTIILVDDIKEQFIVNQDKDITLDLNGHKISDNNVNGKPVIENYGKITIINGTVTSSLGSGVINNDRGAEMHIGSNARVVATGTRQAVYNDGGTLLISDNAYLSNATNQRAAVQSLNNGSLTITGGTIVSANAEAVKAESGSLVIGVADGSSDNSSPILQGATYGLNTSINVSIYDGVLKGRTSAINNTSRITVTEPGATPVGINPEVTEVIDGKTYKILYFE